MGKRTPDELFVHRVGVWESFGGSFAFLGLSGGSFCLISKKKGRVWESFRESFCFSLVFWESF